MRRATRRASRGGATTAARAGAGDDFLQPRSETVTRRAERREAPSRRATSRKRGGATLGARAGADDDALQPQSETADAPGGGEVRGVE